MLSVDKYTQPIFHSLLVLFFAAPIINGMTIVQTEKPQAPMITIQNLPPVIQALIEMLNNSHVNKGYSELNCWNSLLICGPAGNGKATYAHTIAEQTGAQLIELYGTYFTSKEYDGIERLRNLYKQLKETVNQTNKPIVLLIKDADVITDLPRQCALWCFFDKIRYDSRILIILTVKKHLGIFDARLSSRMRSLEVENPTYEQRVNLINFYWNNSKGNQRFNSKQLKLLATKSEGLSIKELRNAMALAVNSLKNQPFLKSGEILSKHIIESFQKKPGNPYNAAFIKKTVPAIAVCIIIYFLIYKNKSQKNITDNEQKKT